MEQEYTLRRLREETEDYPDLQDFDEESSVQDGHSTAPISGAGTPLAAGESHHRRDQT
jgi:ATP-dependent helicase STH1/SNF2